MITNFNIQPANPAESFMRGRSQAIGIKQQKTASTQAEQNLATSEYGLEHQKQQDQKQQEVDWENSMYQKFGTDAMFITEAYGDSPQAALSAAQSKVEEYLDLYTETGDERYLKGADTLQAAVKSGVDGVINITGAVANKYMGYLGEKAQRQQQGQDPKEIAITQKIRDLRASGSPEDAAQADQLEQMSMQGKTGLSIEERVEAARKEEFAKVQGRSGAELLAEYTKESSSALKQEVVLDQMLALLDSGVPTGPLSGRLMGLKGLADDIGLNVDLEKLAGQEAIRAIGNKLALQIRNPDSGFGLPGATSDRDLTFLSASIPNEIKTEEGNRVIIMMSKEIINHTRRVARAAEAFAERNGSMKGWAEYLDNWKEENPIFSEEERASYTKALVGEGETSVNSVDEAEAAGWTLMTDANGNQAYVSPDGSEYKEL